MSVTRTLLLGTMAGLLGLAGDPAVSGAGGPAGLHDGHAGHEGHDGMVRVPAGAFASGCNREAIEALGSVCEDDPARFTALNDPASVELPEYWIDEHEVTVAAYAACVAAGACTSANASVPSGVPLDQLDQLPVTGVKWMQAAAYCTWRGKRLPSELEWEKAARGSDARVMPWGNSLPACGTANVLVMGQSCPDAPRHLTPVGWYPDDVSPYGVRGMAGNAQEWVADWRTQLPGEPSSARDELRRSVRGGYYGSPLPGLTLPVRRGVRPDRALARLGFRCASG